MMMIIIIITIDDEISAAKKLGGGSSLIGQKGSRGGLFYSRSLYLKILIGLGILPITGLFEIVLVTVQLSSFGVIDGMRGDS